MCYHADYVLTYKPHMTFRRFVLANLVTKSAKILPKQLKMSIFQNRLFSVKIIYKLPLVTNFQARSVPELGRDTISLPDPLGFAET